MTTVKLDTVVKHVYLVFTGLLFQPYAVTMASWFNLQQYLIRKLSILHAFAKQTHKNIDKKHAMKRSVFTPNTTGASED